MKNLSRFKSLVSLYLKVSKYNELARKFPKKTFEIYAGNLIILKPSDDDAGLYQCAASNSEGVVFSHVIQVEHSPQAHPPPSRSG
jgi:hypothetical protein